MLAHSLAETTRAGYRSAIASLASFCAQQKLQLGFPVSPDTLCLWMAAVSCKLTYGSIRVYLHGIGTTHTELGMPSPLDSKLLWRMFAAVKRLQGAQASKQKLPITTELLLSLERWQVCGTVPGLSLRAAMWLGTCGLLRSGEFALSGRSSRCLRRSDLVFLDAAQHRLTAPEDWPRAACMRVHLAASKTDPFRHGVDVLVSNAHARRAMTEYMQTRNIGADDAALFVGGDGNAPLTVAELLKHTRALLAAAGIADASKYAGHSFRRGGATSLHYAGVPDSLIRVMGRWRSFTFARYIDVPFDKVVSAGLCMTTHVQAASAAGKGKSVRFTVAEDKSWPSGIWE